MSTGRKYRRAVFNTRICPGGGGPFRVIDVLRYVSATGEALDHNKDYPRYREASLVIEINTFPVTFNGLSVAMWWSSETGKRASCWRFSWEKHAEGLTDSTEWLVCAA